MALRDVDRRCVLRAMEEFDRLGREEFLARYGFGPAREYFVVEGGRRYDSKALVGAAHQFTSDARALSPSEFSGGANVVQPLLWRLGFRVVRDPDEAVRLPGSAEWDLAVGETIRRVDLHERYGGSRQDGVSPSRSTPNVFLFTAASSGEQHGYFDRWREDGYFYYTGRGQRGDQTFTSGNLAILNHREDGRALRVFEGARGTVEYAGEFQLADDLPWIYENAPETGSGPQRRVIIFRLTPVPGDSVRGIELAQVGIGFQSRREDIRPAAAQPGASDPDVVGRGLSAHRRLENDLASLARARGSNHSIRLWAILRLMSPGTTTAYSWYAR